MAATASLAEQQEALSAFKTLVHVSMGFSRESSPAASTLSPPPPPSSSSVAAPAPAPVSAVAPLPPPPPTTAKFSKTASILLIGMRGVGKTTLGLILATYLNRPFIDVDRLFERVTTVPVREFIATNGWDAFRDKESGMLEQVLRTQSEGKVIALGGGVVEREANRKLLVAWAKNTGGPVIHVCRQIEDVFYYLKSRQTKSTWGHFQDEYRTVWERRITWYQACSNIGFVMVSCTTPDYPSLSLKRVEALVHRLVRVTLDYPTPSQHLNVDWNSPRTTAVIITGEDPALHNAEALERVTRGADAIDFRVDTCLRDQPSNLGIPSPAPASLPHSRENTPPLLEPPPKFPFSHISANRNRPGIPKKFQVALANGFLRQKSTLPIIYTVRTVPQGGLFLGSKSEYMELVAQGFRLVCDFVDIELTMSDQEIKDLMALSRGGISKVILSWAWTEPEAANLRWTSEEVHRVYARAVRLGADVVRLSKPASSISANFELAELRATLAAQGNVPLIGVNVGEFGKLGRLFSSILTPITHPELVTHEEGEMSFGELQAGRKLIGFEPSRSIFDLSPGLSVTSISFNAGISSIGLNLVVESASQEEYESIVTRSDFGGALISLETPTTPSPSVQLSPAAISTGFADVAIAPPLLPSSLFNSSPFTSSSPPPLSKPPTFTLDNIHVRALRETISFHLSPANANPKSAVVEGAHNDRLGRELFCALASMGIKKIFSLDCDEGLLESWTLGRLSITPSTSSTPAVPLDFVKIGTLGDIKKFLPSGRPPTIAVSWSATSPFKSSSTSLPSVLAESSTGGVLLVFEGEKATDDPDDEMKRVRKEEDGWIRLFSSDVQECLVSEQFKALTGKELPVIWD